LLVFFIGMNLSDLIDKIPNTTVCEKNVDESKN